MSEESERDEAFFEEGLGDPPPTVGELERYVWHKEDLYGRRRVAQEEADAHHARRTERVSTVDVNLPPELATVGIFGSKPGQALFYPGQLNGIHGPGGLLKSWINLFIALQQVRRTDILPSGEFTCALLFDFEVGLKRTARRLHFLGATEEERGRIIWTNPSALLTDADKRDLLKAVDEVGLQPSYAGWDAVSTAMGGLSGLKGADVNAWISAAPGWVLRQWESITEVLIDHTSRETPGSFMQTGAVQKFNAIQGAEYLIKLLQTASKTDDGGVSLTATKDQESTHTVGDLVAQFNMGPSYPGGLLQEPTGQTKKDAQDLKEDVAKVTIIKVLLSADDNQMTSTELKLACGGNATLHTRVRDEMSQASGDQPPDLIAEKRGKTVIYRLADPKSWITLSMDEAEGRFRWRKNRKRKA